MAAKALERIGMRAEALEHHHEGAMHHKMVAKALQKSRDRAGVKLLLMARQAVRFYKSVLNFHIILNSIGYFAGMTHGVAPSK
jgi:hypothetical protein